MITKAYLERRSDEILEIATPKRYTAPGWYPSAYRIGYEPEAKEYRVALTRFEHHGGPATGAGH